MGVLGSITSTNRPTTTQQQNAGPIFPSMPSNHTVLSPANTIKSLVVFRQQIDESHHDMANLLTQQMATVLNPSIVSNNACFEQLARQVG